MLKKDYAVVEKELQVHLEPPQRSTEQHTEDLQNNIDGEKHCDPADMHRGDLKSLGCFMSTPGDNSDLRRAELIQFSESTDADPKESKGPLVISHGVELLQGIHASIHKHRLGNRNLMSRGVGATRKVEVVDQGLQWDPGGWFAEFFGAGVHVLLLNLLAYFGVPPLLFFWWSIAANFGMKLVQLVYDARRDLDDVGASCVEGSWPCGRANVNEQHLSTS